MNVRRTRRITEIAAAADLLRTGHLVAIPTETVYGLGADAKNPEAVARIFESKQRPHFDPLIVHVCDTGHARDLVTEFPPLAERLAAEFWPGPLTLVLPRKPDIPDLVTAGLETVGVRVPDHPLTLKVLTQAGCPIAAPSANLFGSISPTKPQHVLDGLDGRIDAVLDGGPCAVGVESTVLSLCHDEPTLLRPGGLPLEDLEAITGPLRRAHADPELNDAAQPSPGMLTRHYAPDTKLRLIEPSATAQPAADRRCGLLTWGEHPTNGHFQHIEQLSDKADMRTCATSFFGALRSLDSAALDVIIARKFPSRGLGLALNDRLTRAAAQ